MNPLTSPLLTDLYQLTMLDAYRAHHMNDTAVFELFVRKLPLRRPRNARRTPCVSCVRVEEVSIEDMARAARDARTALLVVRFDAASSGDLAELLARTSCPLVLMR
jgi:nicotinic acid phosphoribosyltransferase